MLCVIVGNQTKEVGKRKLRRFGLAASDIPTKEEAKAAKPSHN